MWLVAIIVAIVGFIILYSSAQVMPAQVILPAGVTPAAHIAPAAVVAPTPTGEARYVNNIYGRAPATGRESFPATGYAYRGLNGYAKNDRY